MNRATDLSKRDFEALSEFRFQLQRFLRFAQESARMHNLTPLQYQLLLHIEGYPGRRRASIGEIAERLQRVHHGVVALVSRCERAGLIRRRTRAADRRVVELHLTAEGARRLRRVAQLNRDELRLFKRAFNLARTPMSTRR